MFREGGDASLLGMIDDPSKLRVATVDELADTLCYALRFNGRKRAHTGDEYMAQITAERLIEHLRLSGYVVRKKPIDMRPAMSAPLPPRS